MKTNTYFGAWHATMTLKHT